MTIDAFAEVTHRIIARDGFDEFLPTACYPARRQVAVLQGVPASMDIERAALDWAFQKANGDEEFLLAFKSDSDQFKVVRRASGRLEEIAFKVRNS